MSQHRTMHTQDTQIRSATPTGPTIGVVIVSYNTRALLARCLESLRGCCLPLRILVVDNASTDDSVAYVQRHFPDVSVHALTENCGFAAATNIGLRILGYTIDGRERQAQGEHPDPPPFALLLNPDTVVHLGAIEALVEFLLAHPRVALVGPRLLNPDGSIQLAAFRFPTLMMSVLDVFPPGDVFPGRLYHSWWHGRYPQETRQQQETSTLSACPFPIDHPLGACMLIRQPAIAQIGLLDERYFMYSEEIDWCWRLRQAGWAIWQVPQARVTHVGGAATSQFRQRMLIALHRSRVLFFQQHYSTAFLRTHRAITRLGMLRAILLAWYAYWHQQIGKDALRARLYAWWVIAGL